MRSNEVTGHWYKMPDWLLFYDPRELSIGMKVLYMYISGLSNNYGYCYANNDYLSCKLGISVRSINRYLGKLIELNFIRVEICRNNKNRKIYPLV